MAGDEEVAGVRLFRVGFGADAAKPVVLVVVS